MKIVKLSIIILIMFFVINLISAQDICETCIEEDPAMCPPECFGQGFENPMLGGDPSGPGAICGDGIIDEELEQCETNSDCNTNEECIDCICIMTQIPIEGNVTENETVEDEIENETVEDEEGIYEDEEREVLINVTEDAGEGNVINKSLGVTEQEGINQYIKGKKAKEIFKTILLIAILIVILIMIIIIYKIIKLKLQKNV